MSSGPIILTTVIEMNLEIIFEFVSSQMAQTQTSLVVSLILLENQQEFSTAIRVGYLQDAS